MILGIIWQIIRIQLLSNITLKSVPELALLLEEDETLQSMMKLQPEVILLRWANHHLKNAGYPTKITNFSSDLQDSSAYSALMNQLDPVHSKKINGTDPHDRAWQVIENAKAMGIDVFLAAGDIVDGNKKLNLTFVAQLFEKCNGLELEKSKRVSVDLSLSSLELDDDGDNREERALRMWVNSLGIDDVYINNLFADLDDGWVVLKLCEQVKPGCMDWKRYVDNV